MKITLHFVVVFATFTFVACNTAPVTKSESNAGNVAANAPQSKKSPVDPKVVEFLITSAATDFSEHPPPGFIAQFRNVRIGHLVSEGRDHYRMCGEYSSKKGEGEPEWVAFATLQTSGYEQYVGSQSATYCQGETFVWDDAGDQSSVLQGKVEGLQHGKK